MKLYLYDNFIMSDKFVSERGDGGPELFLEMTEHIKHLNDKKVLGDIINEIEIWIKIGAPSFFVMGVNLVGLMKLEQYRDLLLEKRDLILRGLISDLEPVHALWIDNALKMLDE